MTNEIYRRYAFISYSHRDVKIAKWLHKELEAYKLPAEIQNEFENSQYLRPVFRDIDDLDTGVLKDELRKKLWSSKYLIVICSPNSNHSKWVNAEIQTFIEWGRISRIIPFVAVAKSNSNNPVDDFADALKEHIISCPKDELLGIDINELGKEKALVRIVSRMLNVDFDVLWKRHRRQKRIKRLQVFIASVLLGLVLYVFAIPVQLTVCIKDEKHCLPLPQEAILKVDGAIYPLTNLDTCVVLPFMPGWKKWRNVTISFRANYYNGINKKIEIAYGMFQTDTLRIYRDDTFRIFAGHVVNEDGMPLKDVTVCIGSKKTLTKQNGDFFIEFLTNEQKAQMPVRLSKKGYLNKCRLDESPSTNICYVMKREN